MTEKASVLGGMFFWQGGDTLRVMALFAEFFSRLFFHALKFQVDVIHWKFVCFFGRGVPEKKKDSRPSEKKQRIV